MTLLAIWTEEGKRKRKMEKLTLFFRVVVADVTRVRPRRKVTARIQKPKTPVLFFIDIIITQFSSRAVSIDSFFKGFLFPLVHLNEIRPYASTETEWQ